MLIGATKNSTKNRHGLGKLSKKMLKEKYRNGLPKGSIVTILPRCDFKVERAMKHADTVTAARRCSVPKCPSVRASVCPFKLRMTSTRGHSTPETTTKARNKTGAEKNLTKSKQTQDMPQVNKTALRCNNNNNVSALMSCNYRLQIQLKFHQSLTRLSRPHREKEG